MRLKKANHNRRIKLRVAALKAAYEYDEARAWKLQQKGQLWRRHNSGYVRRAKARAKQERRS